MDLQGEPNYPTGQESRKVMEPIETESLNEFFNRILSNDSVSKDFWEAKMQANKLVKLSLIFDECCGDNYYGD